MGVTNRLVYVPGDDTGSGVGAYVRAGDDGTEIGHVVDALKVSIENITATDLDIRTLDHTFDGLGDSIRLGDGTNFLTSTNENGDWALDVHLSNTEIAVTQGSDTPWSIDDNGGSLTVDAVQLDVDDLNATDDAVASWTFDGTGTAITSTGTALDVNIASGDLDDNLANAAISNEATAVSLVAVDVVVAALANRKWLYTANEGNKTVYFGETGVTILSGFPSHPGQQHEYRIGPAVTPQFIGEAGAAAEDMRVMELS